MPGEWMDEYATDFRLVNGQLTDINVWQALRNPAGLPEAIHMILASYCAAGFAAAGVHALLALRDRSNRFHQRAIAIALLVGGSAAVAQAVSGDALARMTARNLPTKLAAMEGDFQTRSGAPLRIGGLPDVRTSRRDIPSKFQMVLACWLFIRRTQPCGDRIRLHRMSGRMCW
jgi:cytochrome d ubiquinol oxidase subunit I